MADEDLAGEELPQGVKLHKSRPLEDGEWGDIVLVRPNGQYILYKCEPTLKNLQALVGGYIEVVPRFSKYGNMSCIVLVDEEGRLKNKPYNNRATIECAKAVKHSKHQLFGDVVVLSGAAKAEFERDDGPDEDD